MKRPVFHNGREKISWVLYPAEKVQTDYTPYQQFYDDTPEYIHEITHESRLLLQEKGDQLAGHLHGQFILAANKTDEKVQISSRIKHIENGRHLVIDYVRGCILLDSIHNLTVARKKIQEILEYRDQPIARSLDRYAVPTKHGLRGIFLAYTLPNGLIAEIQIHKRDYWDKLNENHEQHNSFRKQNIEYDNKYREQELAINKWSKGENFTISQTQIDEMRLAKRQQRNSRIAHLERIANQTGVNKLLSRERKFNEDCSYPVRPGRLPTGENGYWVDTTYWYLVNSPER